MLFLLHNGENQRREDTLVCKATEATMGCLQSSREGYNLMNKTDKNERIKIVQSKHLIYKTLQYIILYVI